MTAVPDRTLVVTNDFPPRAGGIQTFVHELVRRQPAGSLVVYAPAWAGAERFDAEAPFPIVRHPGSLMLPVAAVARRAVDLARAERCRTVWFGAAAPLGLLAPVLRRRAGVQRVVGSTHGHEAGWAMLPGPRQLLRRIFGGLDAVTYLGRYTLDRMGAALSATPAVHLPPGVDTDVFHPGVDGDGPRRRLGLAGRPTVVCVSRLVPRKGQDVLIRALPLVRRAVPDAALLVVGGGPDMPRLQRLAAQTGGPDDVVFTGPVPGEELPAHYGAGDVFAMPCRTRRAGLDVEGLGIVYLEASAVGLPVLAGASGGAPDAVREGETGHVVDGRSVGAVAARLVDLLADPAAAQAMGRRGRAWVERDWRWDVLAARLACLLRPDQP